MPDDDKLPRSGRVPDDGPRKGPARLAIPKVEVAALLSDPATDTIPERPREPPPERRESLTAEQPGRYVVRKEFGRGGQSVVYLALDQHIGREIALKQMLRGGTGAINVMGARFIREARITGQLEHPNIVPVYEVGRRTDGSLYYTQKLVRGRTMTAALKECKTLRDRLQLLSSFVALCQAIAYAHRRGVIHRDIKPDNVMVGEFGETVVLDWGLARARGQTELFEGEEEELAQTQEGDIMGTPAYMSPEQAVGSKKEVDEQSDVWSLGAVLYELLTGRPPFVGRNALKMIMAVAKDPIPRISSLEKDAPPELAAIADRALTRERHHRYKTVKELIEDVEAWRTNGRVSVYAYTPVQIARKWLRKNRTVAVSALLVLLVLLGGIARVWWENRIARRNLAQAFLEKSNAAGRELQWGRAAAYAAAARVEDDSAEARFRAAHRAAIHLEPLVRAQLAGPVDALAVSPDGKRVAVAVNGDRLLLLDGATGKELATLDGFEVPVSSLTFSPDGSVVVAGGLGSIAVWNAGSGEQLARMPAQGVVEQVAFAPDGTRLGAAMSDLARVYDGSSFRQLLEVRGHDGQVTSVAFPAGGKTLITGGADGTIRTWRETPDGLEMRFLRGEGHQAVARLALSPSGKVLVSGSADQTVRFFDLDTGIQIGRVNGNQGPVQTLATAGEGTFAVLGQDATVLLADFATQGAIARVEGDDWSSAVALAGDASLLATANREGRLRLWKLTPGDRVLGWAAPKGFGKGLSVAFAPTGRRLATGDNAGHVVLWDVPSGKLGAALELPQGPVESLAFSPDGKLLAAAGDSELVSLFDLGSQTRTTLEGHQGTVHSVAFSPDGKLLASAGQDGIVRLWDLQGRAKGQLDAGGQPLYAVAFSHDGKLLASGGEDKALRVFDVGSRKLKKKAAGAPEAILAVAFSPHASVLATGGKDQAVRIWRTSSGELRSTFAGHGGRVWSLAFSTDGETLASASYDGTVRLWDVRTGRQVIRYDRPPDARALACSADGRYLASVGERPAVQLIELADKSRLLPASQELERQLARDRLRLEGIQLVDDQDALAPARRRGSASR